MSAIERAAFTSVARGCGFAGLGILLFMVGLAPDPALALKVGGILTLLVCLVLLFKAARARNRPYNQTETWLILKKEHRPGGAAAQQLIGGTLQVVYLTFARHSAGLASLLFVGAVLLALVGAEAAL